MMNKENCGCMHHGCQKLVGILTMVAALGFWLSTLLKGSLFGISAMHYFKEVIVFGILGIGMGLGACSCCGTGGKCAGECGAKCGTCSTKDMDRKM